MRKEPVSNNVPYIVGCNNTKGYGIMTVKGPKGFEAGITKETFEETLKNFVGGVFYVSLLK